MKVYGLTGGVGMGKSTSDRILRERGFAVVDTDLIAREIVEPGQSALAEIQTAFGPEIIDTNGRLRREDLGRRVFGDSIARARLEAILHPRIRAIWQKQIQDWRSENLPLAVVVIPLLYETEAASCFDAVICVACSATTQKQRLSKRGLDSEQIEKRIAAQWPTGRKLERATYVVWTEAGVDVHSEQLRRIIPEVK